MTSSSSSVDLMGVRVMGGIRLWLDLLAAPSSPNYIQRGGAGLDRSSVVKICFANVPIKLFLNVRKTSLFFLVM